MATRVALGGAPLGHPMVTFVLSLLLWLGFETGTAANFQFVEPRRMDSVAYGLEYHMWASTVFRCFSCCCRPS